MFFSSTCPSRKQLGTLHTLLLPSAYICAVYTKKPPPRPARPPFLPRVHILPCHKNPRQQELRKHAVEVLPPSGPTDQHPSTKPTASIPNPNSSKASYASVAVIPTTTTVARTAAQSTLPESLLCCASIGSRTDRSSGDQAASKGTRRVSDGDVGGGRGGGSDVTWSSLDSSARSRTGVGESTSPVQHSGSGGRQAVSLGLSILCMYARL